MNRSCANAICMSKFLDRYVSLLALNSPMVAWLSTYTCCGVLRIVSKVALVMKFWSAQARLLTWKIIFVSASVESAAMTDCILHDQDMNMALRSSTLDCIWICGLGECWQMPHWYDLHKLI